MDDAPRFVAIDQEAEFRAFLERVPELPQQLRTALEAVPVSRDGSTVYRPCEVELDDGQVVDGVYLIEARSYFSKWGVAPWNDSWKRHVPVERIRGLRDSPTRLPPEIADELYEHGEDGMGYCVFELVLADGRVLACQTGNAVDFVALPDGGCAKGAGTLPATDLDACPNHVAGTPTNPMVEGTESGHCINLTVGALTIFGKTSYYDGCEAAYYWAQVVNSNAGVFYQGSDLCPAGVAEASTDCGGYRNAIRHFFFSAAVAYDAGREGAVFALGLHEEFGKCFSTQLSECEHDSAVDAANNNHGMAWADAVRDQYGYRPRLGSPTAVSYLLHPYRAEDFINDLLHTAIGKAGQGELDLTGGCQHDIRYHGEC